MYALVYTVCVSNHLHAVLTCSRTWNQLVIVRVCVRLFVKCWNTSGYK